MFANVCDFHNNLDFENVRSSIEGLAIKISLLHSTSIAFRLKDARVNHKRKAKRNSFITKSVSFCGWSHVWLAYSHKKKATKKCCQSWCLYKRKIKLSNLSFVSRKKSLLPVTENLHLKDIWVAGKIDLIEPTSECVCQWALKFMHIKHFPQPNQ